MARAGLPMNPHRPPMAPGQPHGTSPVSQRCPLPHDSDYSSEVVEHENDDSPVAALQEEVQEEFRAVDSPVEAAARRQPWS